MPVLLLNPLMRQANPPWKVALVVFSLLLTALIWTRGLEDSFSRPSVTPKLSLRQHEIALLAEPSTPNYLKPILVGADPELTLKELLKQIPSDQIEERQRLMLATLENERKESIHF